MKNIGIVDSCNAMVKFLPNDTVTQKQKSLCNAVIKESDCQTIPNLSLRVSVNTLWNLKTLLSRRIRRWNKPFLEPANIGKDSGGVIISHPLSALTSCITHILYFALININLKLHFCAAPVTLSF